ncbi:MAG: helix-turn-helix domain-containing protein [Clostridia bacterium]|nr:helix-turn-helix domain-containing protein [Clostridia bacterium]
MTVGERIKNLRERLGISQVDFADRINVSKQTLYKYENNIITNIPSDKIEAVAKIGKVSPAYLMGWEEVKPDIAIVSPDNKILCIVEYMSPPKKERALRLMQYYSMLNEIGQKKALDNLEDLAKIYTEKKPVKYDFTPPEHSMVAEASTSYLAAAHNDHLDEEGELDKVKSDLAKLKKLNGK